MSLPASAMSLAFSTCRNNAGRCTLPTVCYGSKCQMMLTPHEQSTAAPAVMHMRLQPATYIYKIKAQLLDGIAYAAHIASSVVQQCYCVAVIVAAGSYCMLQASSPPLERGHWSGRRPKGLAGPAIRRRQSENPVAGPALHKSRHRLQGGQLADSASSAHGGQLGGQRARRSGP